MDQKVTLRGNTRTECKNCNFCEHIMQTTDLSTELGLQKFFTGLIVVSLYKKGGCPLNTELNLLGLITPEDRTQSFISAYRQTVNSAEIIEKENRIHD